MTDGDADRLYPNRGGPADSAGEAAGDRAGVSRRGLLAGSATAGAALAAGCSNGSTDGAGGPEAAAGDATESDSGGEETIFVFNTDDATVSIVDPGRDEVVDTQHLGLSASFPSNQYAPELTTTAADPLWLNVNRGVRALAAGPLSEVAHVDTGSGSNWQSWRRTEHLSSSAHGSQPTPTTASTPTATRRRSARSPARSTGPTRAVAATRTGRGPAT
ncbi:hypothetical protein ACFQL4_07830 [Halosimplex aquaticum]